MASLLSEESGATSAIIEQVLYPITDEEQQEVEMLIRWQQRKYELTAFEVMELRQMLGLEPTPVLDVCCETCGTALRKRVGKGLFYRCRKCFPDHKKKVR